jgi:hypothetical protein
MSSRHPGIRRAVAVLVGLGLAATLTACDSSGSSTSAGSTTSTRARRRHHPTTTTAAASTGTTTTTSTAPPDTGSRDPPATAACGAELARFTAVVQSGEVQGVPVERYTVGDCRLAPSLPIWGAVALVPKPGETVPHLTVVFERIGSIWNVHSSGSGATGCDAPAPVPTELHLGC